MKVKKNYDQLEDYNGLKGYTPNDIIQFCYEHKIKCFGFNWKLEQFITNKND